MNNQPSLFGDDDDARRAPGDCPSCGLPFGHFRETLGEYHCGDPWHLGNVAHVPAIDAHQLARTEDPDTSHDAAAEIVPDLRLIQSRVLGIFQHFGRQTQHQVIARYRAAWGPAAESTVRTRCSELADAGLVMDSGDRAQLGGRRRAIIWQLTPPELVATVRADRAARLVKTDDEVEL